MKERFKELLAEVERIDGEMKRVLPELAAARGRFSDDPTEANRAAMDEIQGLASRLQQRFSEVVEEMPGASGLPPEKLAAAVRDDEAVPFVDQLPRRSLTEDLVTASLDIDAILPEALTHVEGLLPKGWLEEEPREATRLDALARPGAFLSLTKGLRKESELPPVHRLRQAINVCRDLVAAEPFYDHFAGPMLVPSVVQLARRGRCIEEVGGDRDERLRRLWASPGAEVDATVFELLVAAGCVAKGRSVQFLPETNKKTPDLRCDDPYPLVIECKRQGSISDYELAEEAAMKRLFLELRAEAGRKGVRGTFRLSLSVAAEDFESSEVVGGLIAQRLAPTPERSLSYGWGDVALSPLPRLVCLREPARLYGPAMLEELFGWNSDLPDWDGVCCSIETTRPMVEVAKEPVALLWRNVATSALRKRTWAPTNLFGSATRQIPSGHYGIVYVAYVEGARPEVADLRVDAFKERIQAWEHSAKFRLPISILDRLYPRPLRQGAPDLIESGIRFMGEDGIPELFDFFPTTVFTEVD